MKLVEWNDSYSVGNDLMDAHHRIFFRMIREFSEPSEMADRDGMMKRIAFLVEYVAMHLGSEEELMRQSGYPDLERHAEVHRAFSQKVLSARDSFFKDQASVTPDQILEMMQGWFLNHILGEDKKYSPYVMPQA